MEKTSNVDRLIQFEPEFEGGNIVMSCEAPKYWSRLGSPKTLTREQRELGKELVQDLMMEAPEKTVFAFTDRSCLTKPMWGSILFRPA